MISDVEVSTFDTATCLTMMMNNTLRSYPLLSQVILLAGWSVFGFPISSVLGQDSTKSPEVTGDLLTTLFSPVIATEPKAMAVFQRTNLLDRVTRSRSLQLALVVDATESMSSQLEGIRKRLSKTLEDLKNVLGDELEVQIVLYRDAGAKSIIEFPLSRPGNAFSNNIQEIEEGLIKLVPGSGAPYFLEPVDFGLYSALTALPWSSDASVARWIMLIGDAPPFENTSVDETGSQRKYSDDQLILLAKEKGINIHTVLCPTREEDKASYETVLPRSKDFFSKLALHTEGICFDLSDANFQNEIRAAAVRASVDYLPIESISEFEIQTIADAAPTPLEARTNRPITFAVLPFMPKQIEGFSKGMNYFDPGKNPSVLLAEELSRQLDKNGAKKISAAQTREKAFDVLKRSPNLREEQVVKAIGESLVADYVICVHNSANAAAKMQYRYAIIETRSGQYIVRPQVAESEVRQVSLASDRLLTIFAKETKGLKSPSDLRSLMTKLSPNPPRIRNVSLADSKEAEDLILQARIALDEIVQFELISENDVASKAIASALDKTQELLDKALMLDRTSTAAFMMEANVYMARILLKPFDRQAEEWKESAVRYLDLAKRNVPKDWLIETAEIEADIAIMQGNFSNAAAKYASIIDPKIGEGDSAKLRARWMLMGIHSGDWDVKTLSKELVDPVKARKYAIEILAFHPNSPHADRLRKALQISSQSPKSASPNLPIQHSLGFKQLPK